MRPRAFRWTCCGLSGNWSRGCDHHGSGEIPCTCDFCAYLVSLFSCFDTVPEANGPVFIIPVLKLAFCIVVLIRLGEELPDDVYRELCNDAPGVGLNISRGPDPRSYDPSRLQEILGTATTLNI